GVPSARARAIPNGCDSQIFHYSPSGELRRQINVASDEQVILFVGWLDRTKGIIELLEAFSEMTAENPKLRLVCVGEGSLRSEIVGFARDHGFAGHLLLAGVCSSEEVAHWMNVADVFCLPSYAEGCPNVVIEAQNCGCPVVAADVAGTNETL